MIEIYTDGSCKNNPGIGSFGFIIYINNQFYLSYYEYVQDITTNNIMELKAIYNALFFIYQNKLHNEKCILFTDSQYATNGLKTWIYSWIKNNWKTSDSKPVLNASLWKDLFELYSLFINIDINWIRAHTNNTDIHSIRNKYVDSMIQ